MARSERQSKDIELELLFATGEPLSLDSGDLVALPSMMLLDDLKPGRSTAEAVERGEVKQRVTNELPSLPLEMDALKIGDEVELQDGSTNLIQYMNRGRRSLGLGKRKGKNYLFVSLDDVKRVNGEKVADLMEKRRNQADAAEGLPMRAAPLRLPKYVPAGLMDHQLQAVSFIESHDGRGILALEMGLGKTVVAAVCIKPPAVAVVPAQVNVNWVREINRWRPDLTVALIKGGKPELVTPDMRRADVVVLNYEIVGKHLEWLRDRKHRTAIADEAQYIKNLKVRWDKELKAFFPDSDTQRANDFYLLQKDVPSLMLLTGTPVMNRTKELWPMLHLVDPNEWGSFYRFCMRYCGGHQQVAGRRTVLNCDGRTNSDELFAKTNSIYMVRMKKADVLNLPEKQRRTKVVSLDPKVAKQYAKASQEFLSWVEEQGGWEAAAKAGRAQALARMTALRELAAVGKAPAILDEIVEFFESTQRPLVVMARSRAAMALLRDGIDAENESFAKLGPKSRISRAIRHESFVGGLSATRRQEIVDSFQRGEIDVLFYSIDIATGVTLTRSQDMFFVERNWRPADQLQAEDRCILEGEKVLTRSGYKEIQDIRVGDEVLTRSGDFSRVIDTGSRSCRELITEITYRRFNMPLRCTSDHRVLVRRLSGEVDWIQAQDVKPGSDMLVMPRHAFGHGVDTLHFPEHLRHDPHQVNQFGAPQKNGRYVQMPEVIRVTPGILRLFGWYLAEGCSITGHGKGSCVSLSGHEREESILNTHGELLSSVFGVKWQIYRNKKSKGIELRAYSRELALWFKDMFGGDCYTKRVPSWFWDLSREQVGHVLQHYIDGDGYRRKSQSEVVTVSPALATWAHMAILATKDSATFRFVSGDNEGQIVVGYTDGSRSSAPALCVWDDRFVYHPVSSVKTSTAATYKKEFGGQFPRVHDLTVASDESFVVGQAVVHNCHRIGQKNELTITYYDGEGTMDAAMALLLADKVATAAAVVDGANLSEEEALQVVLGEMVQPELPPALRRNRGRISPAMTAEEAASLVDMRRVDDDGNIIDRNGEEDEEHAPGWADAMVTNSWHDPL